MRAARRTAVRKRTKEEMRLLARYTRANAVLDAVIKTIERARYRQGHASAAAGDAVTALRHYYESRRIPNSKRVARVFYTSLRPEPPYNERWP